MATFLPLGTGFYQATNPRNPKDVNITTLLAGAVSDAADATAAALTLVDYADDAAAAAGGVPVGGLYQTSGTVKVRVS